MGPNFPRGDFATHRYEPRIRLRTHEASNLESVQGGRNTQFSQNALFLAGLADSRRAGRRAHNLCSGARNLLTCPRRRDLLTCPRRRAGCFFLRSSCRPCALPPLTRSPPRCGPLSPDGTCGPIFPYSLRDCVKSPRSSYTGFYSQSPCRPHTLASSV